MQALAIAITQNGKIVGYISGENHTTDKRRATVYRSANHAAQVMIRARSRHPAWNVDAKYGMEIVNAHPV
jgi:pyruvoyl-dependent arginine decarboxylase (PvlArgDC)